MIPPPEKLTFALALERNKCNNGYATIPCGAEGVGGGLHVGRRGHRHYVRGDNYLG